MAGTACRGFGIWGSTLDSSSSQRCLYGELVAECRSSEQLENETPSTSEDDDSGLRPSDLYGKFTWKIDKFSQINKRELRSSTFEVGGHKWYILIYPQGCDAHHHLSLFLCVADHDRLLPGWSHSALFTISVVSKDPKKSKYSDTLHRFWKKEHDWGWKRFMELPKVLDEFLENDTLIIKAQVQVIREKANCPFRCLDFQYKRELARVYLSQVEKIFRRFVEERREKLMKFTENKARWTSFCSFWKQIDVSTRKWMCSENRDVILRRVVKQFFVETEVTSILVMDSLYFGLKALEGHYSYAKGSGTMLICDATQAPIALAKKEVFVLADDVVPIIEKVVLKPLPPKDEKGPQQLRTKDGDGVTEDDSCKNVNEQSEWRLAELGHKSLEIYILDHIFSNRVEIAYQEAVSLQMQEALIREEAEYEKIRQRSSGKEKKPKKKQAKQKQSHKKEKGKMKDKAHVKVMDSDAEIADDMENYAAEVALPPTEQHDASDDVSDLEDTSNLRDHYSTATHGAPISLTNGTDEGRSLIDDSSSTCSTDSISSVLVSSFALISPQFKTKSVPRKKNQQHYGAVEDNQLSGLKGCRPSGPAAKRHLYDESLSSKVATKDNHEPPPHSLNGRKLSMQHVATEDVLSPERQITTEKSTAFGPEKLPSDVDRKSNAKTDVAYCSEASMITPEAQSAVSQKRTEKLMDPREPLHSTSFSGHGVPSSRPAPQSLFPIKPTQLSGNNFSISGQNGPETSTSSVRSFASQSYKNAVMQNEEDWCTSSSISLTSSAFCPAPPRPKSSLSAPSSEFYKDFHSMDSNLISLGLSPGSSTSGASKDECQWINLSQSRNLHLDPPSVANDMQQLSLGSYRISSSLENISTSTAFQTVTDEFPHLDLINHVLDDDSDSHDPTTEHFPDRHFSFPGEFASSTNSLTSEDSGHQGSYNFYTTQLLSRNDMMPIPPMHLNDAMNSDQLHLSSFEMFSQMQQDSYLLPPVYPNSSNCNGTYRAYGHGNGY